MMKKTKIDWCDFTWNPVTGCRHTCEYCYARKLAQRFCGDVRLNKSSDQLQLDAPRGIYTLKAPFLNEDGTLTTHYPAGFEPTLHEYRLDMVAQKKKPANIFVCSMADLFGEWVPTEWITRVFDACKAAPWHNYLFLTKNPHRYAELYKEGKLPLASNFWYGVTATSAAMMEIAADAIGELPGKANPFLSAEPLACDLTETNGWVYANYGEYFKWIIVGAETGNRKNKTAPRREWIENIVEAARKQKVPILLKDSTELREVWGDDLIQEFPPELQRPAERPLPRCEKCRFCETKVQGNRGKTRACEIGWSADPQYDDRHEPRHIPAHYAKQSPLWCPLRKEDCPYEADD